MVRCKFKVDSISKSSGSRQKLDAEGNVIKNDLGYAEREQCEMATVKMSPVYANNDPKHENSKYWDATPMGSFEMGTVNADAVAQLKLGDEYYIDISPAPKAIPGA